MRGRGEECWRAYRGIGHSWFLIESPYCYNMCTCVHRNTHLVLLSNFPADGSEELNTSAMQQPSNPPHRLSFGRVTDKALHQSRPLTAACSCES